MAKHYKLKTWRQPKPKHLVPTKWLWTVSYPENLLLEKDTDIGAFTYIHAGGQVLIREGAKIGSHCSIYSENSIDGTSGAVIIGEGACVGSHCTIMPDVTIGRGAKVDAQMVITRDVKEFTELKWKKKYYTNKVL